MSDFINEVRDLSTSLAVRIKREKDDAREIFMTMVEAEFSNELCLHEKMFLSRHALPYTRYEILDIAEILKHLPNIKYPDNFIPLVDELVKYLDKKLATVVPAVMRSILYLLATPSSPNLHFEYNYDVIELHSERRKMLTIHLINR